MRQVCDEIDLHIVLILLLLAPGVCFSWWWLFVVFMIPQGRIGGRTFLDYPTFRLRSWAYLVANELMVIAGVGLLAGLRAAGEGLVYRL